MELSAGAAVAWDSGESLIKQHGECQRNLEVLLHDCQGPKKHVSGKKNRQIYRSQLKSRLHKQGEDLTTLAQDITKLVRKAYPSVPAETKDKFALDSFIDSLNDSDMEWAISSRLVYQPMNMRPSEILAHEYEAFRTISP